MESVIESVKNLPTYAYVGIVLLIVLGVVLAVPKLRGRVFERFRPELYEAGTAKTYDLDDNTKLNVSGSQPFGLYNDNDYRGEEAYFEGDVNLDD